MNDIELCKEIGIINIILKLCFLLTLLIPTVLVASANPIESTNYSANIESITSISEVTDPNFYSLAKLAKLDLKRGSLLGSWSPDGSRLLIVSAIRRLGDYGLTAVYVLNADGTDMRGIVSTLNNTRNSSLEMYLGYWSPNGNKIVIPASILPIRLFFMIADPDGAGFRVAGNNLNTVESLREVRKKNLEIKWQRDFSWNPDGTKALVVMGFQPKRGQLDAGELYVVDENGFILRQITNESIETMILNPVWSHDGEKIAFNGKNLWIINGDGTGLKQLVQGTKNIQAGAISWSLDDSKIFYQIERSIYAINADGTGAFEVISGDNRAMDDIFSLSPDGRRILFTSSTIYNDGKVTSRLYTADADGGNQNLLSEVTGRDIISASWNPKGDKIAFIENGNLYTINPDGSGRATIALSSYNYAWHPSGDYIAFPSEIDKKTGEDVDHSSFWPKEESYTRQVFISKPDGTERVRITSSDKFDYRLDLLGTWSPDGSRLLVYQSHIDLLVIKFNGYDEVMSLHAPSSVQQGEEFTIQVKSMSKPVEKAVVSLNGREIGITNETGHLNYSFKEPGKYLLNATREGYRTASKSITVKENTQLTGQTNITETSVPVEVTDTPKIPGLNSVFSLITLTAIVILRRIQ